MRTAVYSVPTQQVMKALPPAFCLVCEGAIGQPKLTTSLCDLLAFKSASLQEQLKAVKLEMEAVKDFLYRLL